MVILYIFRKKEAHSDAFASTTDFLIEHYILITIFSLLSAYCAEIVPPMRSTSSLAMDTPKPDELRLASTV